MTPSLTSALRSFGRQPLVPALVVVTLALGIGLATAMLAVIDARLLRPLPFASAARLVEIWARDPGTGQGTSRFDEAAASELRSHSELFTAVERYQFGFGTLVGVAEPHTVSAPQITPGLLSALGVIPLRGRLLVEDDRASALPVALIAESLWRASFGADPSIIGHRLTLDEVAYEIVGVLPAWFAFPQSTTEVWRPLPPGGPALGMRGGQGAMATIAVLAGGVTRGAADQRLRSLSGSFVEAGHASRGRVLVTDRLAQERVMDAYRPAFYALFGAALLVLLVAAVNVVSLLLARGTAVEGELAILAALGCSRAGLARRMVIEGLVLAGAGATLGLVLARAVLAVIAAIQPVQLSFLAATPATLTYLVIAIAIATTGLLSAAVSAFPAWRAAHVDLVLTINRHSSRMAGAADERWQSLLLTLQLAMVVVVLSATAVLTTSFVRIINEPTGYDPAAVTIAEFAFTTPRYRAALAALALVRSVDEAIEQSLPGSRATHVVGLGPMGGINAGGQLEIEGRLVPADGDPTWTYAQVAPDYFQTMRIPLLAGRTFAEGEFEPAIVINDVMATRFWGTSSPIGQRVRYQPTDPWLTVIGVAGDVRRAGVAEQLSDGMETYLPFSPDQRLGRAHLAVRSNRADAAGRLRQLIRQHDPDVPVRIFSMDEMLAEARWQPRFFLRLASAFAVAALLVAAVGIYGAAAYRVTRRRREIAVRIAVGATPTAVIGLVLRRSLLVAACGTLLALPGLWLTGSAIRPWLHATSPWDPMALGGVVAVLVTLVVTAGLMPALRASRIDPVNVLKSD